MVERGGIVSAMCVCGQVHEHQSWRDRKSADNHDPKHHSLLWQKQMVHRVINKYPEQKHTIIVKHCKIPLPTYQLDVGNYRMRMSFEELLYKIELAGIVWNPST